MISFKFDQQEVNEAEWKIQGNWIGPTYFRYYFSKKDTRLWVPKNNPKLGWTINVGHRFGLVTMLVCLAIVPISLLIPFLIIELNKVH